MKNEKRSNQGYEIIESCTIGSTELVIGYNPKAPNPYVCWYCKGGDNYYWGCYCNELSATMPKRSTMFPKPLQRTGSSRRKQRPCGIWRRQ